MEYYQFLFEQIEEDKKEILVALLSNIGFTGFDESDLELKAFINKDDLDQQQFEIVISKFDSINYSRSIIKEENWNEQWEKNFAPVTVLHPVSIEPFVHIRAGFHEQDNQAVFEIIITPKMSFGTGHHATTYLVAEQMAKIDFNGKSVIDFGTGTGVLSILAEKLGAAKITAIDHDDWSIENAKENISTNNCKKIDLIKTDTIPVNEKAAVILANINLNIILANLSDIRNACGPGAAILFSGIMVHDENAIAEALRKNDFHVEDILHKDGWIAIIAGV